MLDFPQIVTKTQTLKQFYAKRDGRMETISAVRRGDMTSFDGMFPDMWPQPIVANFVDTAARDIAEMLAPLPTFSAATGAMIDDTARSRADKRNKIIQGYCTSSRLDVQMYAGADRYITYGFLPFKVSPNYTDHKPTIIVDDPVGGYPEWDLQGRTTSYTKRWRKTLLELIALFPDQFDIIMGRDQFGAMPPSNTLIEVVQYHDGDQTVMFLPERKNHVLVQMANPLGKCLVHCAKRPALDDSLHGQFDDVLWVQLARSKFALLALEAATKAVQAPIALPNDVQDFAIGPDALLRSASPEKIGRVPLQVPHEAFAIEQNLASEQRLGARYPESRTGNMNASVITGRGVEALSGGFDSQIKAAQQIFATTLMEVMATALELDEKLWPDERKTVTGTRDGTPYQITYRPSADIKGDYKIDVTYGLMAGLDPNRALVFVLQGLGADLYSRDWARRNLPGEMNVSQEEQMIDIEKLRGATMQAVEAYVQAIPAMAAQGQDPSSIVVKMANVIHSRRRGTSIEDAVSLAFAPPPPPEGPPGSEAGAAGAAPGAAGPGGGQDMHGLQDSGLLQGVAPGQAGMAPGGRPSLQNLLAGLSSKGSPELGASVSRRTPVS